MKRDGACISLWQDTVAERNLQSNEFQNPQFDVLIVGGGITGITTALLLQKKGKRCVVAESHNICFGTTGGTTAHLNTFFDTTYDQIISDFGEHNAQLVGRATRSSLDLFKQHVQEYSIDCGYEQKNGYVYAQTNEQLEQLQKIFEATQRAGVAVSYTESIPVPVEFRKAIYKWTQAGQTVPLELEYRGEIYSTEDIVKDPVWGTEKRNWEMMLLTFRVIQPEGPNQCRW